MTQKELAALSDIRAPYLNEIELLGVNVSLKLLHQIAQALNVLPSDLLPTKSESDDSNLKLSLVRQKVAELVGTLTALLKVIDEPTPPRQPRGKSN